MFLCSFTHGHVKQLHAVLKAVLVALATGARDLLPGADVIAFVNIDSMHRQVYGYQKQGSGTKMVVQGSCWIRRVESVVSEGKTRLGRTSVV
jgi:hypothetical protein